MTFNVNGVNALTSTNQASSTNPGQGRNVTHASGPPVVRMPARDNLSQGWNAVRTDTGSALRNRASNTGRAEVGKLGRGLISSNLRTLSKRDLLPGDVIIRAENPPIGETHEKTQKLQNTPDKYGQLNGIPFEENVGDYHNVHALIWTHNPKNPLRTERFGKGEPEAVDARGALHTIQIRRVQPSAMRPGDYKVYRPTDQNRAGVVAQVAMMWAEEGNVEYSTHELIAAAVTDSAFSDKAKEDAVKYAKDGFSSSPEWARNPINMDKKYRTGAVCSTLIGKVFQAADLNILQAKAIEQGMEPPAFSDLVDQLEGFSATNPIGTSVKTLEHFMRTSTNADGSPEFVEMGELHVNEDETLYPEECFPGPAKAGPPLPPDHPHAVKENKAKL